MSSFHPFNALYSLHSIPAEYTLLLQVQADIRESKKGRGGVVVVVVGETEGQVD